MATASGSGLLRELNWVHSVSIIVGTMIGSGIFVVTQQAAGAMGPAVPIGFLIGIPIILTTALIYSVFMSSPLGEHPGGAYIHISRTWNSLFTGYIFMWLKFVSFIGALAVLTIGFGQAMQFFPAFQFLSVQNWAVVWLTVFFVINLVGIDDVRVPEGDLEGLTIDVRRAERLVPLGDRPVRVAQQRKRECLFFGPTTATAPSTVPSRTTGAATLRMPAMASPTSNATPRSRIASSSSSSASRSVIVSSVFRGSPVLPSVSRTSP